jgi:hypothetical protein
MNKKLALTTTIAIVVALTGIGITATTTNSNTVFGQSHNHCLLPNGNGFPGQGGLNSNPDSNGGGCPAGLAN